MQDYGCYVLKSLAANAANRVSIAAKGGIDAVVAALNAHRASEYVH